MDTTRKLIIGTVLLAAIPSLAAASVSGQDWDAFNARDGEPVPEASTGYRGTSVQLTSGGYDVFGSGYRDM